MFQFPQWTLPNTEVPAGSLQGGPGSSESGVWRKSRLGLPRRGLHSASDGKPAAAEHRDCAGWRLGAHGLHGEMVPVMQVLAPGRPLAPPGREPASTAPNTHRDRDDSEPRRPDSLSEARVVTPSTRAAG